MTQPSKPIVYFLCGASGSGKSWVANQLLDKYEYISYDGNSKKDHIILLSTLSPKPKLYDPTFKISTLIKRHSDIFDIKPVFIYEDLEILKQRLLSRGGEVTSTLEKRNDTMKKRHAKYGGFIGTSAEVLEFLKNEV